MSHTSQDQLNRGNLDYSEDLYKEFLRDPSKVEDSWRWFFQGLNTGLGKGGLHTAHPLEKELQIFRLFQHYRDHGSLKAKLNPLGDNFNKGFPSLKDFRITKEDLDKEFAISKSPFWDEKTFKRGFELFRGKILWRAGTSGGRLLTPSEGLVF